MSGGRSEQRRGASSVFTRLSDLDHELCSLLSVHRVLTTTQLVALSGRPERTVDYRLQRLREHKLVDRTRPYIASGSAPFSWWLTRSGARLVEGVSPAPGKATPNPLFLRHTTAIAGLYVALRDIGSDVGLSREQWLRDEDAWEDWSPMIGRANYLRPDAYVEFGLDVENKPAVAPAFVEIDFATMDQARLRAKVARHRDYVKDRPWWNRHPGCPVLLLLTTSEQRVSRFLATAERDRPKLSLYERDDPTRIDAVVAACAAVVAPEEALCAPVWRTSPSDAPMLLSSILSANVRTYRRALRKWRDIHDAAERHQRAQAVEHIRREYDAIATALGGAGGVALRFCVEHPTHFDGLTDWAEANLDLVESTLFWWRNDRHSLVPETVRDGWVAVHRRFWTRQAESLLSNLVAIEKRDPRLRARAAQLARGELVDPSSLTISSPRDGRSLSAALAAEYMARRDDAIEQARQGLSLHRRIVTSMADLATDYDAAHLVTWVGCGLSRHVPEPDESGRGPGDGCPDCGGRLVLALNNPPPPPEIEESLAMVRRRLASPEEPEAPW
jgi:hypothetical protein